MIEGNFNLDCEESVTVCFIPTDKFHVTKLEMFGKEYEFDASFKCKLISNNDEKISVGDKMMFTERFINLYISHIFKDYVYCTEVEDVTVKLRTKKDEVSLLTDYGVDIDIEGDGSKGTKIKLFDVFYKLNKKGKFRLDSRYLGTKFKLNGRPIKYKELIDKHLMEDIKNKMSEMGPKGVASISVVIGLLSVKGNV